MSETILSIHHLSKRYGKIQAVKDLSIEVQRGQIFGILGPNGSGKTTTLSSILELIKPGSGAFEWFGKPPSKESRKRIGSVIESPNFYPYLTASQNLKIIAEIKDKPNADTDEALRVTGLYERRNHKFRTYSFGMKQRLAIASALLGEPDVLILDEPTNGLDPQGIAQIRDLIKMVASQGITIIIASHLLDEVQKICTHVAVLNKGTKLFDGKVAEVLAVTDSLEVSAADMDLLEKTLQTHEKFKTVTRENSKLLVTFTGSLPTDALNAWLFGKGIVATHLADRKRTLEQHFLELLQQNQ